MPTNRTAMGSGQDTRGDRVELEDKIVVTLGPDQAAVGGEETREFEVVGIVEDADTKTRYAVCYSETADQFIVTDVAGALVQDVELAQSVLDDFMAQAKDPAEDEA